jgi:hypothetical protein
MYDLHEMDPREIIFSTMGHLGEATTPLLEVHCPEQLLNRRNSL